MLSTLPALFPALFVSLLFVAAAGRSGFRQSFVYASVIHALCVVGSTELLSIFAWLTFESVLTFWMSMTALAAWLTWRFGDREAFRCTLRRAAGCGLSARLGLLAAVAVLAVVFAIALVLPPNNWESMAYRMMRVAMWAEQHSIAHYPTSNIVQLYYSPLVPWQALHLQILAAGDRFANMPEWVALAGCGVVASLIARELRALFPVQVAAAIVAVTLPMGILQGSSTAANLSAAYWLMCFFLLFIQQLRGPTLAKLACCGLALGFALLSKPTAYVIAPPLALILLLYGCVHVQSGMRCVLWMAVVGTMALTLNCGHYWRNWAAFDHPVSPAAADSHTNSTIDLDTLTANMLGNAALNWGVPHKHVNLATAKAVRALADMLGAARDPIPGIHFLPFRFKEVNTPNLLHFVTLTISMVGLCLWRRRVDPLALYLVAATALAIVFFSAVLTWSQYNSSYHVPLFMLGAPLVAVFFSLMPSRIGSASRSRAARKSHSRTARKSRSRAAQSRSRTVRKSHSRAAQSRSRTARKSRSRTVQEWPLWAVSATLLLASVPWLVFKESAPLATSRYIPSSINAEPIFSAHRERTYFNHIGGRGYPTYEDFVDLIDFVAAQRPQSVAFHEIERPHNPVWFQAYAVYVMLKERLDDVSVEYFGVANESARLRRRDDHAPSIILFRPHVLRLQAKDPRNLNALGGLVARRIFDHPSGMEAWRPVRPFGGTMRALTTLTPDELRFACDRMQRQTGPSAAFFLDGRLVYLSSAPAGQVAAACGRNDWSARAEPSAAMERIVLQAIPRNEARNEARNEKGAAAADHAFRFEFQARDYRQSPDAFAFDVPAQAASVSIAELDGEDRVTWEVALAVPGDPAG